MMVHPGAAVPGRRRGAFTLIELLVVMAVICTLMSMVTGVIFVVKKRGEDARTRALILFCLKPSCQRYYDNHGVYPWVSPEKVGPATVIDPEMVYIELRGLPGAVTNRSTDYLDGLDPRFVKTVAGKARLQDSWGSDIAFRVDPQGLRPVIWSRGRDRVDDTNFEDPPAKYTHYTPPAPPAIYADPAKYPRAYYYLGDGRSRGDDLSSL
jgi:prepilin-type N-terminal cleavage/methylation domain-containing protein